MDIVQISPAPVPHDAVEVSIPMRDGVMLAADVYLEVPKDPRDETQGPVVLVRLPYDKDGAYCFMPEVARYFLAHDYRVVVQDVRGKFRSEGATEFGIHEVEDGYDTIEWIANQDWCDGRVVMWGDSYFGMTQLAAAASGHPALKVISPRVTGSQITAVLPNEDGSCDVDQLARRAYFATQYVDNCSYEWHIDVNARPLADTFEAFFTALGRRSDNYDNDLLAPASRIALALDQLASATPIPTLYTIGWFDNCAVWSWHDVEELQALPAWAGLLHLRLEGIDHESYRFSARPIRPEDEHEYSVEVRARLLPAMLGPSIEFFDHWLGRSSRPVPRVTYEVCNGEWRTSEVWPPSDSHDHRLYAVMADGDGAPVLRDEPSAAAGALSWRSDGRDLVPSVALNPFAIVHEMHDLSPIADRPDVVTLSTAPLDVDVIAAGPVQLTGELTSDQCSTDLFARLLDVTPNGEATLVARGQVHLSGLEGPTRFRVGMLHAGYKFAAGHRLCLHLASSDFPEFVLNPGDGSDPWNAMTAAETTTTVALGGAAPLVLTVRILGTSGVVSSAR